MLRGCRSATSESPHNCHFYNVHRALVLSSVGSILRLLLAWSCWILHRMTSFGAFVNLTSLPGSTNWFLSNFDACELVHLLAPVTCQQGSDMLAECPSPYRASTLAGSVDVAATFVVQHMTRTSRIFWRCHRNFHRFPRLFGPTRGGRQHSPSQGKASSMTVVDEFHRTTFIEFDTKVFSVLRLALLGLGLEVYDESGLITNSCFSAGRRSCSLGISHILLP
jgi:hypothetical protein